MGYVIETVGRYVKITSSESAHTVQWDSRTGWHELRSPDGAVTIGSIPRTARDALAAGTLFYWRAGDVEGVASPNAVSACNALPFLLAMVTHPGDDAAQDRMVRGWDLY